MKNLEVLSSPSKKETEKQLWELFQSYCLTVGNDLHPYLAQNFHFSKKQEIRNEGNSFQKNQLPPTVKSEQKIFLGAFSIISFIAILAFTMLGLFQYHISLTFGIFWGWVFTKYAVSQNNQLGQILVFWTIFALMNALQNILQIGLFFLPFYHSLKIFFIIILLYPKIDLKARIYRDYFLPRVSILGKSIMGQNQQRKKVKN